MPTASRTQDRAVLIEERDRLDRLLRSAIWNRVDRMAISSALDTLRWVLGERAILSPSALMRIAVGSPDARAQG